MVPCIEPFWAYMLFANPMFKAKPKVKYANAVFIMVVLFPAYRCCGPGGFGLAKPNRNEDQKLRLASANMVKAKEFLVL